MDTKPAAVSGPPATVDPQDPIPDPNWLYRRLFVFVTTLILLAVFYIKLDIVGDVARGGSETAIKGLVQLLRICLLLIGALILFYMVAPSAEQITKMIATASAWKKGVSTSSTSRATAADGSQAEATTTVGRPIIRGGYTPADGELGSPPTGGSVAMRPGDESIVPAGPVATEADAGLPEALR